jgi:hypothetical protein
VRGTVRDTTPSVCTGTYILWWHEITSVDLFLISNGGCLCLLYLSNKLGSRIREG